MITFDISVKNNILYADNFMDLVVFDISNLSKVQVVNIEEGILPYYTSFPTEVDYYQSNLFPATDDEFIAYYETVYMEREEAENNPDIFNWNTVLFLET